MGAHDVRCRSGECPAPARVVDPWHKADSILPSQASECGECLSVDTCSTYAVQQYLLCRVDNTAACSGRASEGGCGGSCDDKFLTNTHSGMPGACVLPWPPHRPGDASITCPAGAVGSVLGCVNHAILNQVS